MARRDVPAEMIRGAGELPATHGVQGTSFALVLEATGAPRDSMYHVVLEQGIEAAQKVQIDVRRGHHTHPPVTINRPVPTATSMVA
jgi:hypothetical protein